MISKRLITLFIISLGMNVCNFANAADKETTTVTELREQALNSPLTFDILESLTSEVGARMAGTPQDALAVQWGVAKMKALGFDKVWTEPVTFQRWVRGAESAQLITPYSHELKIAALGLSEPTPKGGIQAEIIQFNTLDDLIKSSPDSAQGKIVFISNRMERFRDGKGYGPAVQARSRGAIEAAKKGALAIVIRSIGTDNHRLPHTGMMRYEDGVKKIPAAALSNPDADLLERIVARGKTVSLKLNIESHNDSQYTSYNVIGEMTGSTLPQEKVIIGGHLDSWDLGTGAIDDGAGVAISMAAAKIIGGSQQRPKRTIRVVLFANEEQGLIGGKAYAETHKKDLANHVTGAESDFGAGKIYAFASRVSDKDLPVVNKMAALLEPLGIDYLNNESGAGSDLEPLFELGMSVFSLHQDGTNYFDLHHTADDTLDKVVPEELAQNTAAYVVFAYLAANAEQTIKR